MDLGVRDPRVVIDDGVHERLTDQHAVVLVPWQAGCCGPVPVALLPADVTVPAPSGMLPNLVTST